MVLDYDKIIDKLLEKNTGCKIEEDGEPSLLFRLYFYADEYWLSLFSSNGFHSSVLFSDKISRLLSIFAFNEVSRVFRSKWPELLESLYSEYVAFSSTGQNSTEPDLDLTKYPDTCTRCGSPAYIGFTTVECSKCGTY